MVALLRAALALAVVLSACASDPRADETARIRAHLEGALAEVSAQAPDLTPAQQAARVQALADLRAYIAAEDYPTNDVLPERTPIFVDRFGARCAMAALIEASGHAALVERIARDHLYARIADLGGDPELARWLSDHGLTLAEAARIQPGYSNITSSRWVPTASVTLAADLGVTHDDAGEDTEAWALAGARLGARRITETTDACDQCVYRTIGLVAEYQRRLAPGGDGANLVGALIQYDLRSQSEDHQFYAIGGAIAALGGVTQFGGKLGLGYSLRHRSLPLLGEVAVVGLERSDGFAAHLALTTGAVW